MFKINDNYLKLPGSYLFSTIAKKVAAYKEANPEKRDQIISLGIGDVTLPLAPAAMWQDRFSTPQPAWGFPVPFTSRTHSPV